MGTPDPRLTLARPDLAAAGLRGTVAAARHAEPVAMQVRVPVAALMRRPGGGPRGLDTELLMGERFDVLETEGGWCWGQSALDGYVGHVPAEALAPATAAPTHRVAALLAHLYPEADIKTRPRAVLSFGTRLAVAGTSGGRGTQAPMARLATGGYVIARHLAPLAAPAADWVAEAGRLVGVPYLWGGRSAFGLDCSALVQLAMQAAGRDCPRDSDMQEAALGTTLAPGTPPERGDLMFWRGHVGVMLDEVRLLHANAHHMAVAAEPLAEAVARIAAGGGGAVTRHARPGAAR